ncbi:MAG: hypothetical protein OXE94_01670 [Aestuariivita sp.]|nr:hypothetical protein [Aestuariivita sp.]
MPHTDFASWGLRLAFLRSDDGALPSINLTKAAHNPQRITPLHAWASAAEWFFNRLHPKRAKGNGSRLETA